MGKRIWQYPEATGITNDDVILLDSPTGGSRSIKANKIGSVLINKTITERGTFDAADDNADGYKKVTVDVPYTDVEVASGPVASWDDGEDLPLKSLTCFIEPQQSGSGTPSPTNICPISGWDEVNVFVNGANQWDEEWELGLVSNITGENVPDSTHIRSKNYIPCKPNTTYYIKCGSSIGDLRLCFYDINKNFISALNGTGWNYAHTTPNNCYYMRFCNVFGSATTYNNDISINYPSTDTSYHAYNGHTYTIDLDGTRYGGTLDVVSGVLTVTKVKNTETFELYIGPNLDNYNSYRTVNTISNFSDNNPLSNMLTRFSNFSPATVSQPTCFIDANTTHKIYVALPSDINITTFEVVYELATPLTIQLTPTQVNSLLGVNNIFADTGDVDVEYQKIWVRPSA